MGKIVIIDDSLSVRNHLKEVLQGAGHNVVEAVDGNDGLDKILANADCDLIISDYNMPGRDGVTMLGKASETLGGFKCAVFMLTTETSDQLKAAGKQVGVIAWIIKPFVPEKILQAIAKVMEKRKAA